jgi:hypothetical protein
LQLASGHFWWLIEDNDNSCSYTSGDAILPPSPVTTPTANFAGLIHNKQYLVYHVAYNDCGGTRCYSIQLACFKFLPPARVAAAGAAIPLQPISQTEVEHLKELPQNFVQQLPQGFQN